MKKTLTLLITLALTTNLSDAVHVRQQSLAKIQALSSSEGEMQHQTVGHHHGHHKKGEEFDLKDAQNDAGDDLAALDALVQLNECNC